MALAGHRRALHRVRAQRPEATPRLLSLSSGAIACPPPDAAPRFCRGRGSGNGQVLRGDANACRRVPGITGLRTGAAGEDARRAWRIRTSHASAAPEVTAASNVSVAKALISGVGPERRRPKISTGRVGAWPPRDHDGRRPAGGAGRAGRSARLPVSVGGAARPDARRLASTGCPGAKSAMRGGAGLYVRPRPARTAQPPGSRAP